MTDDATPRSRRIDHLVIAVHDLDDAAAFYQRLGFQVGARNLHPWGTENRLVQFRSSFLELITVGDAADIPPHAPGFFSFGAFVRDYLARRQGLAMMVLDSIDAPADAAEFTRQGIGAFRPFSFERSGTRPDGTRTHVGFSLAFAVDDALPDAGFFVCQQHYPEAFWDPALQRHDNRATQVVAVTLEAQKPAEHEHFLRAYTGGTPTQDGDFPLAGGRLRVRKSATGSTLAGFTIGTPDLDQVAQRLDREHVPFQDLPRGITIDPEQCLGVRIEFETTTGEDG